MRGMLTLFASYAVGRAIVLQQEPAEKARVRLSEREREAFLWASEGKADWEIGEIMQLFSRQHIKNGRGALLVREAARSPAGTIAFHAETRKK